MIDYLIKVTLTWGLLLAVYELLYRKSTAFTLNRIYLFVALASGLLLPLIPLPGFAGVATGLETVNQNMQHLDQVIVPGVTQATVAESGPDTATVLRWLYYSGVLIALVLSLREIVLILRTAIYGHYSTISNYQIFSSGKQHAPFSFMGWVFISDPSLYDEEGLEYIFKHEQAHNRRWHWLDTLLIQLFFVVFWFHPLVWRYRYLLKLNHEYEADYYAAGNNAYEYGHFLLQQTLLKGTPAIAHSFHFSPIKNRISMLTQTRRKVAWKYTFTVPLLLGCAVLFARSGANGERVKIDNKTTYKGHVFEWGKGRVDSIEIEDPKTGKRRIIVNHSQDKIKSMDGDSLYANNSEQITPAQFRYNNMDFRSYLMRILMKEGNIPDSVKAISLSDMVIDELGKLCYYDIICVTNTGYFILSDPGSPLHLYGKFIDNIVDKSPAWLPAISAERKIRVRIDDHYIVYVKTPGKK